ncbi:MAG: DUF1802 family protein [Chlamydiae bacterium]|nr:DUF1802 family protein [Chlamydiota bacterium]MBI3277181.1 DUF1802 family protein [Chlamydiota bacterium]
MKVLERNSKAFKEWAVVVDALGQGQQVVIFRKGGLEEGSGGFEIENREFFLFPTYEHQKRQELIPSVHSRLEEIILHRPKDQFIHLQYYATIQSVFKITDVKVLRPLEGHHIWTQSLLEERFSWGKKKGLFALILRVFKLPHEISLPNRSDFGGCRSWIDFGENFSTEGVPVLSNPEFHQKKHTIEKLLQ